MTEHRYLPFSLFAFLLVLLLSTVCLAVQQNVPPQTTPLPANSVWAWADSIGSQHAIFISRQAGADWEEPVQISHNEGVNVVPSVTQTTPQDLFVVWSTFGGQQAQLHYRQFKQGVWTEEKEYYTGLSSNTSPSICVDNSGVVWLVWAGFNGLSDEIYYSTWNGNGFETAQSLTNNDIPDIQPVLGIDDTTGQPWVQWQQFSEQGYIGLESTWTGSAWSTPVELPTTATHTSSESSATAQLRTFTLRSLAPAQTATEGSKSEEADPNTGNDVEVEIPAFIKSPESASIHIPGYAIQSLPVRSVTATQ